MRIFVLLLTFVIVSTAQYQPVDNSDQVGLFDCSTRNDGNYAVGECSNGYVQCVAGLTYSQSCQEGLVYLASSDRCDRLSVCSGSEPTEFPSKMSTVSDYSALVVDNELSNGYHGYGHHENLIDCSNLPDGSYSHGCSPYYTICSFGISTQVDCPPGLLFHQPSGTCEWPSLCSFIATSTPAVVVQSSASSLGEPAGISFDCSLRPNGGYSVGCVNAYIQCVSGTALMRSCPRNLVFDGVANQCREQCDVAEMSTVAPTSSSPLVSVAQRKCVGTEVSSYGDCSSKFKRCRNDVWTGARCPGATVFDTNVGLCVYDLPLCKTDIFNPAVPTNPAIDEPSPSYNGIEQASLPYDSQIPYGGGQLESQFTPPGSDYTSNPFFALRHKNRRPHNHRKHHDGRDYEERSNAGKLRYSSRSTRIDGRTHHVDDGFDGKAERYIEQNYQPTFPRSYKHKKAAIKNVWETIEDKSNGMEFEEPLLVTDGVDKALVEEIEDLDLEQGSGAVPEAEESTRRRRSYSLALSVSPDVNICSNQQDGAFVSVGSCRQDFIFCPKSGTQIRAACPIGDLFDSAAKLCILQENCEGSFLGSIAISESVTKTSVNNRRVVTVDACEGRVDGPLALGCSISYVICSSNVGHEMTCPEGLVFDEGRNICDYQERIAICGGTNGVSPFAENLRPIALPYSSVDVVATPRPYKAVDVLSSTLRSVPTATRLPSTQSAYRPVFSTPRDAPYFASTYAPSVMPYYPNVASTASNSADNINDACARLPVGYHQTQICSGSFVYCSGENRKAVKMSCQEHLVYSPEVAQCLAKDKVRGCAEYANLGFSSVTEASVNDVHSQASHTTAEIPSRLVEVKTETYPGDYGSTILDEQASVESSTKSVVAPYSQQQPDRYYDQTESYPADNGYMMQNEQASVESSTKSVVAPSYSQQHPNRYGDLTIYTSTVKYTHPTSVQPSIVTVNDKDVYTSSISNELNSLPLKLVECSSDKPTAFGKCDKRYTVCSSGVDYVMSCGHPLIFDPVRQVCDHSEFVSGCSEVQQQAVTTGYSVIPDSTTQVSLECDPQADSTPFATGFCSSRYAFCSSVGVVSYDNCSPGHLFDGVRMECVVASDCGRIAHNISVQSSTPPISPALDSRCVGKRDNSFYAERECSSVYLHCASGIATSMNCRKHHVFSVQKGRCVAKFLVRECAKNIQYVIGATTELKSFCKDRVDGLYRNPNECTSILQCFGGDMFNTAGCAAGLVFNEQKKRCDYRQNVPGCEVLQDPKIESGCQGFEHGAYIADKEDCTIFYRCVWTRLEKMNCPGGTVFNPSLSVCDYISNVPSCKINTSLINSYY